MTTELPRNTIVDSTGRKWRLIISAGIYVALRDHHAIDLLAEDALGEVMIDPVKRSEVLIAILDQQAKSHGLTSDDVDLILWDRDTAPPAHVALEAALEDFYETSGHHAMTDVMTSAREAQKTLQSTARGRINSPKMKRMIEKEIKKAEQAMDEAMDRMEAQQDKSESGNGSPPSSPSPEQPIGETSPLANSGDDTTQSVSSDGATPPSSTAQLSPQ